MLDVRSPLIFGSVPAGMALAAVAWLCFGAGSAPLNGLTALMERSRSPANAPGAGGGGAASGPSAARPPLFALTGGAAGEPSVQLQGLSIARGRKAALVSIGGMPAIWLSLGETQGDVTLVEVSGDKVRIDTATGFRDLSFSAAASAPTSAAAPPPPGFGVQAGPDRVAVRRPS